VSSPTSPASLTIAPTRAKSLIVVLLEYDTPVTVNSVVDNAPGGSSLYVEVPNSQATDSSNAIGCSVWYAANSRQKARSITVTLSANQLIDIWMFEVQIMNSSSPLQEVGVVNDGASTSSPTGASVTTSNDIDFIASVIPQIQTTTGIHAGNTFTIGDIVDGTASLYLITSQKGAYSPQVDLNLASTFCSSTVAFREAPHSIDVRSISNKIRARPDFYEG
jgi:hypothetical protein